MKTVITSTGDSLQSSFDLRFGRAAWLCVYDGSSGKTEFIQNDQSEAVHGAGPRVAEKVAEAGAVRVISGDFGPKAKEILEKLGIQMVVIDDAASTIQDIIHKIK
mgnify:CR=1 FL=1